MQKCTTCNAAVATVQILDLENGAVVKSNFLCETCAKSGGAAPQPSAIKMSSEILENLLGGTAEGAEMLIGSETICPACQLTAAEFRLRGRLGCARCYDVFRSALLPLLDRVHDSTCHRGRFPGRSVGLPNPEPRINLADLNQRLQLAIDEERYEDAARLRDELDRAQAEQEPEAQ